jgi:hypothetical protein
VLANHRADGHGLQHGSARSSNSSRRCAGDSIEHVMFPPMQEMSFWQVVENSPEWIGVIANTLFAIVTIGVVVWQGRVMVRQNKLMQLEHEHDWLLHSNEARQQVINLARKLHRVAGCIKEAPRSGDQHSWEELQDTAYELKEHLQTLDVSAYSGEHDNWFPRLIEYVDAVLHAVAADYEFKAKYSVDEEAPSLSTRNALQDADKKYDPIKILLDLEAAVRMEFFDFKTKWAAAL